MRCSSGIRSTALVILLATSGSCADSPAPRDAGDSGLSGLSPAGPGDGSTDADATGGTGSGSSGPEGGSTATWTDPDASCARVDVRPRAKASAVWLVFNPLALDGRLVAPAGEPEQSNREMFRELLFGADGVVAELGGTLQIGLASYSVRGADALLGGECTEGVLVPAAYDNADALSAGYEDMPSAQGASWYAMEVIGAEVEGQSEPTQNTVMVVQSAPDDGGCGLFDLGADLQREAVEALASTGTRISFVTLLYASGQAQDADARNAEARQRGQSLAALGGGEAFASNEASAVREAIAATTRQAVSCQITLEGEVDAGKECEGEVRLGGDPLACNDPDGFRLLDASTLELVGAACQRLKSDAAAGLSARFPCDLFVPLI